MKTEPVSSSIKHFGFLDGLRGFSAMVVVSAHATYGNDDDFFKWVGMFAGSLAMPLFYILSSFLLTYRLSSELAKCEFTFSLKTAFFISKYFIRRFFRIYVVYFIFLSVAYSLPLLAPDYEFIKIRMVMNTRTWFEMITLHSNCSFLWSIPVEIVYYFILPLVCIFFKLADRLTDSCMIAKYLFITCLTIFCYFASTWCIFEITEADYQNLSPPYTGYHCETTVDLKLTIFVFFSGSLLAYVYKTVEQSHLFERLQQETWFHRIVSFISYGIMVYFYLVFAHDFSPIVPGTAYSRPGFLIGIVLLLFLCVRTEFNFVKAFFESSNLLSNCGKYSFGIYLFHQVVIGVLHTEYMRTNVVLHLKTPIKFLLLYSVAYLVGYIFFHLLEKHLIKFGNKVLIRKLTEKFNSLSSRSDNIEVSKLI